MQSPAMHETRMTDTHATPAETLFQQAAALESQGKLAEAVAGYEAALAVDPAHVGSLHGLGLLRFHHGDTSHGIALLHQAVALQPNDADLRNSLGTLLARAGQANEALAAFQAALALDDTMPLLHANCGGVLRTLGRDAEALACFRRAIELAPDRAGLHATLASALQDLGHAAEALAAFERAIALRADIAFLHVNRGNLLRGFGRNTEALAAYDNALRLDPNLIGALANRGLVLQELGQFPAALASIDRAIARNDSLMELHFNRGNVLRDMGRMEDALAAYDRAMALDPNHPGVLCNRGSVLNGLNRYAEAAENFNRALALRPGYVEALSNRGTNHQDQGQLAEAVADFDAALAADPQRHDVAWNKSLALLLGGDYSAGWPLHEARKLKQNPVANLEFGVPLWLGEGELRGKKLFLRGEQGLGDTLQFCRYALLASARGAKVTLSVQTPLLRLLRQFMPDIDVIDYDIRPARLDLHAPLMSLPLAFGTTLDSIPVPGGYLRPFDADWAPWITRLGEKTRPRIGLAWSGNPAHRNDRNRSMGLAALRPLFAHDADFISLQTELRAGDAEIIDTVENLRHFGPLLRDFADTAGLIATLDLVITVDTAVAHLAAAMGKPTWILLPHNPDWRWLLNRTDSPWYRSARLFRMPGPGRHAELIAEVNAALDE